MLVLPGSSFGEDKLQAATTQPNSQAPHLRTTAHLPRPLNQTTTSMDTVYSDQRVDQELDLFPHTTSQANLVDRYHCTLHCVHSYWNLNALILDKPCFGEKNILC